MYLDIDGRLKGAWLQTFGELGLDVELDEIQGAFKVKRGRFNLNEKKIYHCASMANDARTWTSPESGLFSRLLGLVKIMTPH